MKKTSLIYIFLGLFLSQISFAQSGKPLYTNPVGLQAYTFRGSWPKGIEATLDTIKSLGVTEMEGGPISGMSVEELRKQLDKRGIKMVSIGADYKALAASTDGVAADIVAWLATLPQR